MTRETDKSPGTQPWFLKSMGRKLDPVVNRPFRREIWGVAFVAQKCRLIPDVPDADGNAAYTCKIADVSEGGFCVVCRAVEATPEHFEIGAQMTLEATDGKRLRVEIRWINKERLGLKRFSLLPR